MSSATFGCCLPTNYRSSNRATIFRELPGKHAFVADHVWRTEEQKEGQKEMTIRGLTSASARRRRIYKAANIPARPIRCYLTRSTIPVMTASTAN